MIYVFSWFLIWIYFISQNLSRLYLLFMLACLGSDVRMLDSINRILTTIRLGGQVRTFINPPSLLQQPTWLSAKYFQIKCCNILVQNIFKLKLLNQLAPLPWQSQSGQINIWRFWRLFLFVSSKVTKNTTRTNLQLFNGIWCCRRARTCQ